MPDPKRIARQVAATRRKVRELQQVMPRFDEAEFTGYIAGFRSVRGNLEITIGVGPTDKYAAMPLTDAQGLVVIHARSLEALKEKARRQAATPR